MTPENSFLTFGHQNQLYLWHPPTKALEVFVDKQIKLGLRIIENGIYCLDCINAPFPGMPG
jgi:hypothetical protein